MIREEVERYNRSCKRLIKSMLVIAPDDPALKTLSVAFALLKRIQVSAPLKLFRDLMCVPYRTRLMDHDTDFFLSDAFAVEGFEESIALMRRLIKSMSAEQVSWTWDILDAMLEDVAAYSLRKGMTA